MPFPNEHNLKLQSPNMTKIRVVRTYGTKGNKIIQGKAVPSTVDPIWFIQYREEKEFPVAQALRFPVQHWTEDEANAWIKKSEITGTFEAASKEAAADNIKVVELSELGLPDINNLHYDDYEVAADSKINDWIEVAKTGTFPQGDLTTDLMDTLIANHNPELHEPPHTLGHIREAHNDKPAMAWVDKLKRVGDTLFAKSKQVAKELDGFVRDGRFKKRSIGIRANAQGKPFLHHIAWLGSQVPAVKGLANVYSYSDEGLENQKEFEFEFLKPKSKGVKTMELTELQVQEKIDAALITDREAKKTEFAEKEKQIKADAEKATKEKLEKEFKEKEEASKKVANYKGDVDALIKEFAEGDGKEKKAKLVPSQVEPLRALLYSLEANADLEYSEKDKDGKDKTVKTDRLKLVREIVSNYADVSEEKLADTKEGVKGDDAAYAQEKEAANKLLKEYRDKGENISFSKALLMARADLGRNKK